MRKLFVTTLLWAVIGVYAQNIPAPMVPARLVNDFASIIDQSAIQELEDSLVAFDKATSTQIAVVTVNDLEGYTASDYALAILRGWGVGREKKNNGIVMLIKPRNGYGGGNVYIAVGTGLEGALNDGKVGRIIDNFMLDDLRNGNYTEAAIKGTAAIRAVVRGEFTADGTEEDNIAIEDIAVLIALLVVFILLIKYSFSDSGKGNGSGVGRGGSIPPIFWGGGYSGRSRGSGSFGGFGGFGGGSGAGGGAGRSF